MDTGIIPSAVAVAISIVRPDVTWTWGVSLVESAVAWVSEPFFGGDVLWAIMVC